MHVSTINEFLRQLDTVTSVLGDQQLASQIRRAHGPAEATRPSIAIIGSGGSGRFSLANLLLQLDLLPTSAVPKRPIGVILSHGPSVKLTVTRADGADEDATPADLPRIFARRRGEDPNYRQVAIQLPSDVLERCDLRIESIEAQHTPEEWWELLKATDYLLFVSNASALLSEGERDFIREVLDPALGLARIAVILNRMDLIPENERRDLIDMARMFFARAGAEPRLIEYSARNAAAWTQGGEDPVRWLVEEVVGNTPRLRAQAAYEHAWACLGAATAAVEQQRRVFALGNDEASALHAQVETQAQASEERLRRAQDAIRTVIGTLLKEELFVEIEHFSSECRTEYHRRLAASQTGDNLRSDLAAFLESKWSSFFATRSGRVRERLQAEIERIYQQADIDLVSQVGGSGDEPAALLDRFGPLPAFDGAGLHLVPLRRDSLSRWARGVKVGAWLLIAMQNIFVGLVLIGVAEALALIDTHRSSLGRQALLQAVDAAFAGVQTTLRDRIGASFDDLARRLNVMLRERSMQSISALRQTLEGRFSQEGDRNQRHAQLEELAGVLTEMEGMLRMLKPTTEEQNV